MIPWTGQKIEFILYLAVKSMHIKKLNKIDINH